MSLWGRTVILAAGNFPARGSEPYRVLRAAARVVACDSAAENYLHAFGRWPDVIIGDLDSLADGALGSGTRPSALSRRSAATLPELRDVRVVRVREQRTNDLVKAIRYCRKRKWQDPIVVGATGLREDHTIGNVFSLINEPVPILTEAGSFLPIETGREFNHTVLPDSGISVFASSPEARMVSRGLRWPLAGVRFSSPAAAILNRSSGRQVTVRSTSPAYLYVARDSQATRVLLSLGSNLGNREAYLARALAALAKLPETCLVDQSGVFETEGVEVPTRFAELKFLNQAAICETRLDARTFSREMHRIEDRLGRKRTVRNGPRTIDIDLIDFGGQTLHTRELTLPHPRAFERDFVLKPLRQMGIETECRDRMSHIFI